MMISRRAGMAAAAWIGLSTFAGLPSLIQAAGNNEIVAYRLAKARTVHTEDAAKAKEISGTLEKLGCECKVEKHAGHIDITYQCPKWKSMKLDSHAEAHKWEDWLKKLGFETQHSH